MCERKKCICRVHVYFLLLIEKDTLITQTDYQVASSLAKNITTDELLLPNNVTNKIIQNSTKPK